MAITSRIVQGQGQIIEHAFPDEVKTNARFDDNDPTHTINAVFKAVGFEIIPANGWEVDHCTIGGYVRSVYADGHESTITIEQTNTGTGNSSKVCTWGYADANDYISARAVGGVRDGYTKVTTTGNFALPWASHYADGFEDLFYGVHRTFSYCSLEFLVYLKRATTKGIIYSPTRNKIIYDTVTGKIMYYP